MHKITAIIISIILIIILFSPLAYAQNSNNTKTPIKHVITILFENHTFDNFFGLYPMDNYSWNRTIIKNMVIPNGLINTPYLKELKPVKNGEYSTIDPIEGYTAYHIDWDNGKMNNFINGSGIQSMTYFTSYQLGLEWSIASEYSIADNYFAPQLSESAPNTLYYIAGFTPVINDYGPPPSFSINETIFGELSHYGISWNIYVGNKNTNNFDDMQKYLYDWNSYSYHLKNWSDLINESYNGTLPSVSYVFSQNSNGYSQAAPENVEKGEIWLAYLINKIELSPVWNSTAIFITYDDPGGYFDHVSPPKLDGVQLGMRLPLIVISPYAKEDYVSNTLMTHTSILAFIDYNWDIPALNKFVSDSNLPLDMFNFIPYANGNVARPPINIDLEKNLPSNLDLSLRPENITLNFSYMFPFVPQFNYSSLPYNRTGYSNSTLSELGFSTYLNTDKIIVPFYYEPWFFLLLIIIGIVMLIVYGGSHEK
ncbi:MAG: alkaline phosphatase family protein [Thermoplasmata archaeon]